MSAPKAFISHATEDKDSFVIPFATKLRENGVDAWVDQWEIKAGESLVDRIFESGIRDASIFIVVLSATSIAKPWVRDELDAGVMKRISGQSKLIPVLLDDVDVPVSLQHTLYLSVPKDGIDGVVDKTVHSIFELDNRPPLGPPPFYTSNTSIPQVLPDAVDNTVLNAIVDLTLEETASTIDRDLLLNTLKPSGISASALEESVEILQATGRLQIQRFLGGHWYVKGLTHNSFLEALAVRGLDVDGLKKRLLAAIVNDPAGSYKTFENQPQVVTKSILGSLEQRGLISCSHYLSGNVRITAVSAEATRLVRRG